jgi:hypothetical protein
MRELDFTVRGGTLARTAAVAAATLLTAACGDSVVTGPGAIPSPVAIHHEAGPGCSVIDFNGFHHGDLVTSATAAGATFTVAGAGYVLPDGSPNTFGASRVFDADATDPRDTDLQWNTPGARCPDCQGLGGMLVIENERGFFASFPPPSGDATFGGTLTFTTATSGTYYIQSLTVVDADGASSEQRLRVYLDGGSTPVATAALMGDGSVQTLPVGAANTFTSSFQLRLGTVDADDITGSGAVDNIIVCRVPDGPGTGTPGYWKNHIESWPVSSIMIGGVSYTAQQAIALMANATKGDKTYNLFEHLVAAKLNVLAGNNASCINDDIAAADAWLTANPVGSGVKASSSAWTSAGAALLTELDAYNNGLLCAPSRG